MKKFLFLFSMTLFAFLGNVHATDKIFFSVDKVTIQPGESQDVTVYYTMDGETDYLPGFQVEFMLPDGLHVTGATASSICDGITDFVLQYTDRRPDDNMTVFLGSTVQGLFESFPIGENLELFTFTVTASEDMVEGEYPVVTSRMEWARVDGQEIQLPQQTITFVVGKGESRYLSEDDEAVAAPSVAPEDVVVKRTIKANNWSTICLPFAMTGSALKEAFGNDVKISELVDEKKEETEEIIDNERRHQVNYKLFFEGIDLEKGISANHPYIIKTSSDITEIQAKQVMVESAESTTVTIDNSERGDVAQFVGTVSNVGLIPENGIFLQNNLLYVTDGTATIKGFRGYILIEGMKTSEANANLGFYVDNEETSVDELPSNVRTVTKGNVYTLSGMYVGRAETVLGNLPSGVYIVNNKKYIVK